MKFLDVTIRNFGSFHGQHPPFKIGDRGLVLILGDNRDEPRANSNGAGKSMVLDAVDWCLFGVVPRGDSAESVMNEKAGKDCEVEVRFEMEDGTILRVSRVRKVKGVNTPLRFWLGEEDKTTHDGKETQRRLERELGLDRDVFHAAVLFAQRDEWRFADGTDAERKAILSKIVPELAVIDVWLERVKVDVQTKSAELQEAQRKLEVKQGELTLMQQHHPGTAAAEWDAQHATNLNAVETEVQSATAALTVAQNALGVMHEPAAMPPAPRMPDELSNSRMAYAGMRERVAVLESQLSALQTSKTCPTCGQPLPQHSDPNHAQQAQALPAEIQTLKAQMVELEQRGKVLSSEWERVQAEHAAAVANIHTLSRDWANAQTAVALAQQRLDKVLADRPHFQSAVNPHAQAAIDYDRTVHDINNVLQGLLLSVREVEEELEHLNFWKDAFGPRGIKSHILDTKLQAMSDESNRWLRILFGGTVWVRFETQTKVGKGKNERLVDTFNIRVFRHNPDGTQTERNYRSWSGGEGHRIGSGIDFGLARLVASRALRSYDVLFLDEIFQKSLDQSGKEAVAEMLAELMKEKSSIFVIDHDPRFQGMFSETVVVQKTNGESRIMEAQ